MRGFIVRGLISLLLFCLAPIAVDTPAHGQILPEMFRDPTDGAFDTGEWLLNRRGFLATPIIVTEPALGYGGGVALLFFHRSKKDRDIPKGELLGLPPSVSFVMGLGTETRTWATGGGHWGSWREDSIRYLGAIGGASMNLDFYIGDRPLAYNLKGIFVLQELQFRLFRSPLFFGARFIYNRFETMSRDQSGELPGGRPAQTDAIGGLGPVLRWDTRDNIFGPTTGQDFLIMPIIYGPWMGGDESFQKLDIKLRSFHTLHSRLILGLRFDTELSFGKVPFYALPSIKLRGVSLTRYQDEYAGAGEVELTWKVHPRWSLLGFFGMGWSDGKWGAQRESGIVPAGGGGFRYLIARQLGLNAGIDVAGSSGQGAFYIQVGSAW